MEKTALEYNNAMCLACRKVYPTMVKVGPMIFCSKHFIKEFGNAQYDTDSNVYKKWIEIYKESY